MRVLHFFHNTKRFLRNYPFYKYYFNTPGIQAAIVDFLLPNETVPKSFLSNPIFQAHSNQSRLEHIEQWKPDIIHCHHIDLIEPVIEISKQTSLPVAFTLYRHQLSNIKTGDFFPKGFWDSIQVLFVPNNEIREKFTGQGSSPRITVLSEVLESTYYFSEFKVGENRRKTFAALISSPNESYIQSIHKSLEKILITNHTLNIAWVCMDPDFSKPILEDLAGRRIKEYVSIVPLNDFPMLRYEGLVTDGNCNQCMTFSQYFHLLLSCFMKGKLLITTPEQDMEDVFVDGVTCFVLAGKNENKLSHLIHFLINFPEEMENLVQKAKVYSTENFSAVVMQERLKSAYEAIQGS